MCDENYILPEITMVGGKTERMQVKLYSDDGSPYYKTSTRSASVSMSNFDKTAVYSGAVSCQWNTSSNEIAITFNSAKTETLFGKYIYQLTVLSDVQTTSATKQIVAQGIINIIKNLDAI